MKDKDLQQQIDELAKAVAMVVRNQAEMANIITQIAERLLDPENNWETIES